MRSIEHFLSKTQFILLIFIIHFSVDGRSFRRTVIEWLDVCCPLPDGKSWLTVGYSAITKQQQFTTYDCGVACLLYAEKCGQEQVKD